MLGPLVSSATTIASVRVKVIPCITPELFSRPSISTRLFGTFNLQSLAREEVQVLCKGLQLLLVPLSYLLCIAGRKSEEVCCSCSSLYEMRYFATIKSRITCSKVSIFGSCSKS